MRNIRVGRSSGILEVKRPDPAVREAYEHCGMGVLISPRVAVTCAHVVNVALMRRPDTPHPPSPDERIMVAFPMAAQGGMSRCRVVKWRKVGTSPLDDLAALELEDPAPDDVGIAVLAAIAPERDEGGELSVYGIRAGREVGEHVVARQLDEATSAWKQLATNGGAGIEPGFSGAGVWDESNQATIGIAARRYEENAYFVPAEHVIQFAGDIPHERRSLSSSYARVFTVFGGVFFAAALSHMLADRVREFPHFLSLGAGNEILAAFFGLHLILIFMPVLLWKMLTFAIAFREHPWWMRVPQFGFFGSPPRPSASRTAAAATLVVLVAMPLYMGGHFLRRLHGNEMKVYIDAKAQGYAPERLVAAGESCGTERREGYCTHERAGLYSLVPPGAPGKGGYFDSYYLIGGLDRQVPRAVTFYPVLQPFVLWGLAVLCVGLSGMLVARIGRRAKRLHDVPAPGGQLQ